MINGQIVILRSECLFHSRVKGLAYIALRQAVRAAGLPCEVVPDGPEGRIDDHTVYEPDALVFWGGAPSPTSMLIPNPVILVEVLSPTSSHHDASAKLIGYFKVPSVAHCLVIDPEARTLTHHSSNHMPNLMGSGALQLDPPGLDLTIEGLFGAT